MRTSTQVLLALGIPLVLFLLLLSGCFVYGHRRARCIQRIHASAPAQALRATLQTQKEQQEQQRASLKEEEEPPLVACIVEPRRHRNLVPVVRMFLRQLECKIVVWHGTENEYMLTELAQEEPRLELRNLQVPNLTIDAYNALLTTSAFYETLHGTHILIFQTDSVLCSQSAVQLKQFVQYDYVGAPWRVSPVRDALINLVYKPGAALPRVGNGGLSLRNRKAMMECCTRHPWHEQRYRQEDVYFAHHIKRKPSARIAAKFSYEHVHGQELPWGCHKHVPHKFENQMTEDELEILRNYAVPANV